MKPCEISRLISVRITMIKNNNSRINVSSLNMLDIRKLIKFQLVIVVFALSGLVFKYFWTFCVRLHDTNKRWLQR